MISAYIMKRKYEARIHEGALASMVESSSRDGIIKRAVICFTASNTPIAETHPRFLALKQEARSHSKGLKNQIASAKRLVIKSVKSVRRFAPRLDAPHPVPGARSIMTLRSDMPHSGVALPT